MEEDKVRELLEWFADPSKIDAKEVTNMDTAKIDKFEKNVLSKVSEDDLDKMAAHLLYITLYNECFEKALKTEKVKSKINIICGKHTDRVMKFFNSGDYVPYCEILVHHIHDFFELFVENNLDNIKSVKMTFAYLNRKIEREMSETEILMLIPELMEGILDDLGQILDDLALNNFDYEELEPLL